MPATLASLVRNAALKLTVLAGHDGLDAAVHWVHTSELDDPTPYLAGGELLLTTGLKLGERPEAQRAYIHRLADAGVVGLGFGVGLGHDTVPGPLLAAADERGLPLLMVPRPTPFIAISKTVSATLAADRYEAVTTGLEAQRELTRAALAPDGTGALLARLAAHLDGWAALYDASGAVTAAAPHWAGRRATRLAGEIDRLRGRSAPAAAAVSGADGTDDRVEIQSLGTGRHPRGFLAVGTGERLEAADRYVVHAAVALLTLSLEQSRALQEAEHRFGAALLRMLLVGECGHARDVAGRRYGTLLDRPVRLLVAEPARGGGPGGLAALADQAEAAALRAAEPLLVVLEGDRLTLLAAEGGAVLRACAAFVADADAGGGALAAGMSQAAPADDVPGAGHQAEGALAVARRRGRGLVEHDEVGTGSVLPLLADDAVHAFAEGLLRPLREHDATSRGDLVASLRAWLSRHGQWDAAAADLGVHRHTLRYRMRRVEEILDRGLDDPDVRMELWLALKTCG